MNFFKQIGNYLTLFKIGRIGNVEAGTQDHDVIIKKQLDSVAGTTNKKIYTAILSQSGTAAPIATILENSIGNIVWSRQSGGSYLGTLTGAFTAGKTIIKGPFPSDLPNNTNVEMYSVGSDNINTVYILSYFINPGAGTVTLDDNRLYGNGYSFIEITIYE